MSKKGKRRKELQRMERMGWEGPPPRPGVVSYRGKAAEAFVRRFLAGGVPENQAEAVDLDFGDWGIAGSPEVLRNPETLGMMREFLEGGPEDEKKN